MESIAGITLEKPADKISANLRIFLENNSILYPFSVKRIQAGRNSKVYQIEKNGSKWILKEYYQQEVDPRNRLKTEFSFLSFLNKNCIENVAEAIASDSDHNWGLYSFLPGKKPVKINSDFIRQATEFIQKINEQKNLSEARYLSNASEACFSIIAHLKCVEKRVNILEAMVPTKGIDFDVFDFIKKQLVSAHNQIVKRTLENVKVEVLSTTLPNQERILSPSDFGFQNTLINGDSVSFLDFEYAGWDDPAKLICDFGCHPEIPVSDEYLQALKNSFYPYLENAENSIHRSEILMPLYRLKWCCIMLNEFTSVGRARRKFAGEIFDFENQFQKSKTYFNKYLN
jgi:thiamine kinase-like enzyme